MIFITCWGKKILIKHDKYERKDFTYKYLLHAWPFKNIANIKTQVGSLLNMGPGYVYFAFISWLNIRISRYSRSSTLIYNTCFILIFKNEIFQVRICRLLFLKTLFLYMSCK